MGLGLLECSNNRDPKQVEVVSFDCGSRKFKISLIGEVSLINSLFLILVNYIIWHCFVGFIYLSIWQVNRY